MMPAPFEENARLLKTLAHPSMLRNIGAVEAEWEGNQVRCRIKNRTILKLLDALFQ
jgi:hypothetical protein